MHIDVYMHAYVYGCVCASMMLFDALRLHSWDFLPVYRCACTRMCMCVCMYACNVHVHMCVYAYMCVCVYVCIYMYMHMRMGVHMHSCRRILFICTVQSLYYMRVYHRYFFNTCMHVWWRIGSGVFFSPWLVACVRGCVLTGVEIGGLSCTFLYFCGC